ncbi:MAG: thiamine-phosphate kinase [Rhodospirillales bacterium]|nr:thiamine-phosphate kinase [Rhodospirillales bacterium]
MSEKPGEFDFIATYLRPLTEENSGALGLLDDAALIKPPAASQIVITSDALLEGIHFRSQDPAGAIGAKALGVNLSDLAAMGAEPLGYTMILALPSSWTAEWAADFTNGLLEYQTRYGIKLLGGDTVATPGPLTIGITAIGILPEGKGLLRSTAGIGDDLWLSGTIGDAALSLFMENKWPSGGKTSEDDANYLRSRLQRPEPRVALGYKLLDIASAAIDISDGLAADLGHLCRASKLGAEVETKLLPISESAQRLIDGDPQMLAITLSGGDDYELLFAAPPQMRSNITAAGKAVGTTVTRIGSVIDGNEVHFIKEDGSEVKMSAKGWTHF